MSTDDLTRRARERARLLGRLDVTQSALVSELADEVDRLRDIATRETAAHETHVARLTAERDAARAALERVKAVAEDGDRLDGLWIYAPDITRALEGE